MNFALAGDIALSGLISTDHENSSRRFSWLASLLEKTDGLIANLETPVVSEERNVDKKAHLFSDASVTRDILKMLNVVCVSLANNHILDCGRDGLQKTVSLLDEAGIYHAGAGLTAEQAGPVIFQLAGVRVAFAAYVHRSTNPKAETFADIFLNIFDPAAATREVSALRPQADIVIVSIHWGNDYSFYHDEWQSDAARVLADAGADLIMGHHSHTLQAYEPYRSSHIFYGLGGLTFGDFIRNGRSYALFRKTKNSAVFILDENCGIKEAIPIHEKKGNFLVRGKMNIATRNRRLTVMNGLRRKSVIVRSAIKFHENVLYRVYEYFFGYYMNPAERLFQVGNIRKIRRLFR